MTTEPSTSRVVDPRPPAEPPPAPTPASPASPTSAPQSLGRGTFRAALRFGALGAVVALYLCLVGIVGSFAARPLIATVISLGQTSLVLTFIGAGFLAAQRTPGNAVVRTVAGAIAGGIASLGPIALVLLGQVVDVRAFAIQASPVLFTLLEFNRGLSGLALLFGAGVALGAAAGAASVIPAVWRRPLATGVATLVVVGLFAGLIRTPMLNAGNVPVIGSAVASLARFLFAAEGLTPTGAVIIVALVVAAQQLARVVHLRTRVAQLPAEQRRALLWPAIIVGLLFVLWLPQGVGSFFAQVVAIVAIYILMGFGLNITLGLAGLLDLGFVAFFAVGAYTVGLLTSVSEFGLANLPFWFAVPPAVLLAMAFGIFFGLPILGIRGDYLAIATLGFGEIVRILAGSDLLKPWLGGPQGILNIPKPVDVPPTSLLAGPLQIYYIALVAAVFVAFVAIRLRDSRLGRAWVAIREDEDVAEALGVNLIQTKLLAYMMGAAFAGLGGAIFAGLVGSIFASSMQLYVSINVAALIIVGGMGSIPGVVVGAIFLIGLPELFREFSEYRFLFYGFALIAMMLYRPEGLLPSKVAQRELHVESTDVATAAAVSAETPAP